MPAGPGPGWRSRSPIRATGFTAGFAERAFERFARDELTRTREGAGLGLSIVRAIAEAHGGRAEVVGGAGATVRVWLPDGPAAVPATSGEARQEPTGARHREREAEHDGLPRTWFWAWQSWVQVVAGGATSTASSPITPPMRPPHATSQTETPPQWSTVWTPPGGAGRGSCSTQPCGDPGGDLRAVAADELGREVVADVDARGDGRGRVLVGHDVALAGAEVRVVEVEGVRRRACG